MKVKSLLFPVIAVCLGLAAQVQAFAESAAGIDPAGSTGGSTAGYVTRFYILSLGLGALSAVLLIALVVVLRRRGRKVQTEAALQEDRPQFLAAMKCEMLPPMNAIIGVIDLIPQDNFTEVQKRYFEDLKKMAYALLGITKHILGFPNAESDKAESAPDQDRPPAERGQPDSQAEGPAGFVKAKPGLEINVLVVDDAAINLTVALGFLAKHNITGEPAASGEEALAKVEAKAKEGKRYDIIFMDHMMPVMDGVDTTWRIRAFEAESYMPHTPVIALTANAVYGMKEYSLTQGMDDYISKPIDAAELNRILAKWLHPDKLDVAQEAAAQSAIDPAARRSDPLYLALTGAGCDVEAALSHTGGDMAFLADCVRRFNKDIDGYIAEMRGALAAKNLEAYCIAVHTVKGILATLGVHELSEQARALEEAAKAGDACEKGAKAAIAAFAALKGRLEAALSAVPAALATVRARSLVVEKLRALHAAARNRNLDEAEAIAKELDGAAIEGAGADETARWQAGWTKVKAALDDFAFSDVAAETEALIKALNGKQKKGQK
jgi:CheY-like chemotaxis protein